MVKIECCQSGHRTVKLTESQKWTDVLNFFLHAGINSEKEIDSMIFGWGWSKSGYDLLIHKTLKFALS